MHEGTDDEMEGGTAQKSTGIIGVQFSRSRTEPCTVPGQLKAAFKPSVFGRHDT